MMDFLRQVTVAVSLVLMLWTNLADGRADRVREPGMYTEFPTAFSPAPFTFAVWVPIFLGCIALTVYQGVSSLRQDPQLHAVGWLVAAAFFLTALTAYTPIGISNIVITGLLLVLALAYREAVRVEPQTLGFAWCVRLPIAMFLAWSTVATILNACQLAVSHGWSVGPIPAAVLIGLATAVGVFVVGQWREAAFGIVLIWAFWGIVAARPGASVVVVAAVAGTIALVAATVFAWRGGDGSLGKSGNHAEPFAAADGGA